MTTSSRGSGEFRPDTRTAAVLIVCMADVGEGASTKPIELEHRFEFLSCAARAVRKSDGIVAHAIGSTSIGCFEGASAAAEAHAAAVHTLDTLAARRLEEPSFPAVAAALDFGRVHFLRYAEGLPLDPQGSVIDRSRRLSWATPAGAALATSAFRDQLRTKDDWKGLPKVPISGLGGERLYQLKGYGEAFRWKPTIRVEAGRFDELRDRLDDYQYQLTRKDEQIKRLEQLMRDITGDVDADTGVLTRILTDPKTEELRCRVGDLRRRQIETLLPWLADGGAGLRATLEAHQRVAQLVADLQARYPDQEWSDVDFWVRLLALPTSEPDE
ncbi:MAG: hypothetical protein JRI23_35840 [Deltaproteobacteria bacterium]|jgi:class 3 adenylate cyclase|nr:hypothetical protein [Deltaproteobacteria bacterium]MBW2537718.1 hypothetical protein [Deltaproteobacteria bacterium]